MVLLFVLVVFVARWKIEFDLVAVTEDWVGESWFIVMIVMQRIVMVVDGRHNQRARVVGSFDQGKNVKDKMNGCKVVEQNRWPVST